MYPILVLVLIVLLAPLFGWLYGYLGLSAGGGLFLVPPYIEYLVNGIAFSYVFVLIVAFTTKWSRFSLVGKILVLLPALIFLLVLGETNDWFLIVIVGLIGWLVGFGIAKLLPPKQVGI